MLLRRKKRVFCFLLIGLFIFTLMGVVVSYAESGLNLFIEACQNSGQNSNVINTGNAEFEVITTSGELTKEVVEDQIKQIQDQLKKDFKGSQEQLKESLNRMRSQLLNSSRQQTYKERLRITIKGNDLALSEHCLRLAELMQLDEKDGKWRNISLILSSGNPGKFGDPDHQKNALCISWIPDAMSLHIRRQFCNYGEFQLFGRMQGIPFANALSVLTEGKEKNRRNFKFTPEGILAFKEKMNFEGIDFEITGTVQYDENANAKVLIIKKSGIAIQKYWIDDQRGFICPLIEIYTSDGNTNSTFKANEYFFHQRSKLWFPAHFVTKTEIPHMLEKEYHLNVNSLELNQLLSDREFSIDIPADAKIFDERQKDIVNYLAVEKGEISLAKGGLELDKLKWLVLEEDAASYVPSTSGVNDYVRYVFVFVGIALIIVALCMKYRKRQEGSL